MANENRFHITLKGTPNPYEIWRLNEEEYQKLYNNSLPIKHDSMFVLDLLLSEQHKPDRLTLPKALITLEHLFGKTSNWFDNYKGSFSFLFLLVVKKNQGNFPYLFNISDYRGSLSFSLHRVLENGDMGYDNMCYREPFELEFSREEINYFISYFYGYLVGYSEWISQLPIQPFLKNIDSNHIIYGYQDGEFFEEQIESEEAYREAIATFEQNHYSLIEANHRQEIQDLLRKITDEL